MRTPSLILAGALSLAMLGSLVSSVSAQAPLIAPALMQRALSVGSVRVIAELGSMTVFPEGFLRDDIAVVAQRQAILAAQDAVRHGLRGLNHRVLRQFQTVPLLAIEASPDALRMLETMPGLVLRVHEDTLSRPTLAQSGPLVEAPLAGEAGFDGAGAVIAILDSGVDRNHPFLAGKVIEEACFSSTTSGVSVTTCPNGQEEQFGPGSGAPCSFDAGCAHGTHVAGIAAGNGSGAGATFSGIARGASIMAVQVFSRITSATLCGGPPPCAGAFASDVIAGLERVFALRSAYHFAAVNLSLGGGQFFSHCDSDPRKPIIDNLRSVGIATAASSGNDGFNLSMTAPACISSVISVGSTTKSDTVSFFSNVAPFLSLFAPGSSIVSSVPGGGFATGSGTSMATPHVAGALAILKRAIPGASVSQLLTALQATGLPIPGSPGAGKPRIRIAQALNFFGSPPLSVFVAGFYQDVLGRQPDPPGLAGWTGFLQANCNAAGFGAIGVAFFDSPEFRTLRPLTLNGLVTALYRAFLDRDPDPGGLGAWAQHFREARVALANGAFIPSAEFQSLLPDRSNPAAVTTVVTRFYEQILERTPEPAGLAAWVDYIVTTGNLEGVAVAFIASTEFETHPLTFRDYVTMLYRAFLGRDPEPGGIDGWENVLRQDLIGVIQQAFVPSAEFQGKASFLCGS